MKKAGFTILKSIIRESEICGKKLAIKTLPINGQRINPINMGIMGQGGEIAFANSAMAEQYAMRRVIQPLRSKNPFERAVILRENQVIAEVKGNKDMVVIPSELFDKIKGASLFHGHPDTYASGMTTPVSISDFFNLRLGYDEIRAYSSSGEYSILRSLPEFKNIIFANNESLTIKPPKLIDIICPKKPKRAIESTINDFFNNKKKLIKPDDAKSIKEIKLDRIAPKTKPVTAVSTCIKPVYSAAGIFTEEFGKILSPEQFEIYKAARNGDKAARDKLNEILREFQESKEGRKFINDFWSKHAKEFGIEYSTNYSALV